MLRWRLGQAGAAATDDADVTPEPTGGWLSVVRGEIVLDGTPPVSATVPLALRTATLSTSARPSSALLDWFGDHRNVSLAWRMDDTPALVRLLRDDNPKAWRFLDVSGVIERALPEVAASMARRRADLGDLDPIGALRFPMVGRLDDLAPQMGLADDQLVLAAFVSDTCGESVGSGGPGGNPCATTLAQRLVAPAEAERLLAIVADATLLRAGVNDPNAFGEHELLQLATHLASPAHARDAYELAIASGPLPGWQRDALGERLRLVTEALEHPELTGSQANNLAAARRIAAEHLLEETEPIERLRFASNSYLLSHEPSELARQARLVEPLPRSGTVRVAVSPDPEPDHWRIDVACRDITGLLARLTKVLTDHHLAIEAATIATWPDGAVLDSFLVRSRERPAAKLLAEAFEAHLHGALPVAAMPDLTLAFDNHALPWHTSVIVSGPDQPGALLAVSTAFARAKLVVHTARVASRGASIDDRFTVTDRLGHKLTDASMHVVQQYLAGEKTPRWPRR